MKHVFTCPNIPIGPACKLKLLWLKKIATSHPYRKSNPEYDFPISSFSIET